MNFGTLSNSAFTKSPTVELKLAILSFRLSNKPFSTWTRIRKTATWDALWDWLLFIDLSHPLVTNLERSLLDAKVTLGQVTTCDDGINRMEARID